MPLRVTAFSETKNNSNNILLKKPWCFCFVLFCFCHDTATSHKCLITPTIELSYMILCWNILFSFQMHNTSKNCIVLTVKHTKFCDAEIIPVISYINCALSLDHIFFVIVWRTITAFWCLPSILYSKFQINPCGAAKQYHQRHSSINNSDCLLSGSNPIAVENIFLIMTHDCDRVTVCGFP